MLRAGNARVGAALSQQRVRDLLPRVVTLTAVGAAGLLVLWPLVSRLAVFATLSASILRYPWVVDAAESVNIQSAFTLSQGHDPYGSDVRGFVAAPYPPVYLVLSGLWLRIGGLSLLGGRVISLVATLVVAALAGYLVTRETGGRVAGVLAGVLFLVCGPTIVWATFYRQDLLALAFGLGGLAWLVRWPEGRRAYGAIILFMLAVYTKQTALAAPVAACLYMIWRDRRSGVRFAVVCVVALVLPVVPLDLLTRHGFWRQVVSDHALWQAASFQKFVTRLGSAHLLLLVLAALGLLALLRSRRPSLLAVYAPLGFATVIGSGAVGANNNHLLEPLLACSLLAGVFVGYCGVRWQQPRYAVALVGALLLVAVQVPRMGAVAAWYDATLLPSPTRAERLAQVTEMIRQADGEILTDDSFLLLRAGKQGAYQNVPMLGALASAGRWDEANLVNDLTTARFALVVIDTDVTRADLTGVYWSPAVLAALQQHYRLLYRDILFTYVAQR